MRRCVFPLSAKVASATATATAASTNHSAPPHAIKAVNFDDPACYQRRSTWYLLKALGIIKMCSVQYLARNSVPLMKLSEKMIGKKLTYDVLVRKTIYDYFCAGENDQELRSTVMSLHKDSIGAVLDYAAEADCEGFAPAPGAAVGPDISMASLVNKPNVQYPMDEDVFDENMKLYMMCIMHASLHTPSEYGLAAVKITGMCDPQLLARVSAILMSIHQSWMKHFTEESVPKLEECRVVMGVGRKHQLYITHDQLRKGLCELHDGKPLSEEAMKKIIAVLDPKGKGKVNYFRYKEVLTEAATAVDPTDIQQILVAKLPAMSAVEKQLWKNVVGRLNLIASTAEQLKVRMLIDAEQTFYQLAIDAIVVHLQKQYNKTTPVVYNTYQCYLTYAEDRIANDLKRAELQGFLFGGKVVRGAYMIQERATAEQYSYESPIWPTYEATGKCYESSARRIIQSLLKHSDKKHEVFFGTHNRQSLEAITGELLAHPDLQTQVTFGQLFGMRDNLTLPLAKAGFQVYKYVPYGPVKETVHYLGRRAVENSSILSDKSCDEPRMIKDELKRRFFIK